MEAHAKIDPREAAAKYVAALEMRSTMSAKTAEQKDALRAAGTTMKSVVQKLYGDVEAMRVFVAEVIRLKKPEKTSELGGIATMFKRVGEKLKKDGETETVFTVSFRAPKKIKTRFGERVVGEFVGDVIPFVQERLPSEIEAFDAACGLVPLLINCNIPAAPIVAIAEELFGRIPVPANPDENEAYQSFKASLETVQEMSAVQVVEEQPEEAQEQPEEERPPRRARH